MNKKSIEVTVRKHLTPVENMIFKDSDENDVAIALANREVIIQMLTSSIMGIYNAIRSDELFQRLDNDNKHYIFNALVNSIFFTTIIETYTHLGIVIEPLSRMELVSNTKEFGVELSALIKTRKFNFEE